MLRLLDFVGCVESRKGFKQGKKLQLTKLEINLLSRVMNTSSSQVAVRVTCVIVCEKIL